MTGVTLNATSGQITTVALTLAAAASFQFTVTDAAFAAATDVVILGTTYAGAGTPMLSMAKATAGTFDIVVFNAHASAALNAALVINFAILAAVAS